MADKNLQIVSVSTILKDSLGIPFYQRPYRWSTESAALLFNDMYESFKKIGEEYRIGTVVIYNDMEKNKMMIVDGQQRLTTLSILFYCFSELLENDVEDIKQYLGLFKEKETYNALSVEAVRNNYRILKDKCNELEKNELREFYKYILANCTFVKIITDSEQQAFQFFDCQNSRGKELEPHDLLKSYHLREMNNDSVEVRLKLIGAWEKENQGKLAKFFENHLYPLTKWFKGKSGINYSVKEIKNFKGVKQDNKFNYAVYHKAATLYIERFNSEKMFELISGKEIAQFQLTQPVVAGRRFFSYTLYYLELYNWVVAKIEGKFKDRIIIKDTNSGNCYVRNLLINIVMFYVDKFDTNALTDSVLNKFFNWAYSLRYVMYSVYIETANNYALGRKSRINDGLNLFARISEMTSPSEMDSILLENIKDKTKGYTNKNKPLEDSWFGVNK